MEQVTRLTHFLDKHLLYRILKSLPNEYAQLRLKYLSSSCMVDEFTLTYHSIYNHQPPKEYSSVYDKYTQYLKASNKLQEQIKPYLSSELKVDKNAEILIKMYVKLQYEVGNYEISYQILKLLRQAGFPDPWFELTMSILSNTPDILLFEDLELTVSQEDEKACLLHLALFIGFPDDPAFFLDLALKSKFRITVQHICPSLIRYIQASLILTNRTSILPGIFTLLETSQKYDQTFHFLITLIRDFDYERALLQIHSLHKALSSDYFLQGLLTQIQEKSEEYIFLIYFKIHNDIPLNLIQQANYLQTSSQHNIYQLYGKYNHTQLT